MLDDAETDNQFNEKTVFQAAESQGIDKESCIYYVPRGIINRGNTCFISAVLQALLAVDSFRLLFLYLLNIIRGATEEDIISWQDFSFQFPLVQKLCRVIEQCMLEGSNSKTSGENSANVQVLATKWYSRKESAQAMMSRISKSPISIEDWFQWRRSDFLPTQPDVLSWVNNDTRKGSDRKNSPQEINSSFVSPRLNSFLSFIFGGNQEDSQEFLIHILNELHEEIRTLRKYLEEHLLSSSELQTDGDSEYPKSGIEHHLSNLSFCRDNDSDDGFWEEVGRKGKSAIIRPFQFQSSWISFIFGGILRSELHRIGSKSSVSREPFLFLELDIQSPHVHNLYDALRLYIEPESLDDVFSETTKQKVQARKQVTIERLPRVFILQLKRFTLRNGDEVYRKLGKHIDFPVDLCLPSMLLTFSHSYTKPQNRSYSLAAVVTHLGRELVGGHYICDIRWRVPLKSGQREETVWLNCDDSSISCISEKTVLNRQAYLLFYVKKDES
ncbi:Ubiquitin hydrolase B [Galdieria sulphuraria]|nr:Ubiquitin hydrolase B [Galdieria sulphuraria]